MVSFFCPTAAFHLSGRWQQTAGLTARMDYARLDSNGGSCW